MLHIELMNNVDVNINQRWSLIAIFDIMWQINVTKCETTILYGVCTKSDYRCREGGAAWDPHPLPEGVQALQEGLQDHGELGPRAVHLQVRHIASGQYIICHVRVSGSTRLCWEPGSMRHGASRTWGSWPRCWRTGKSECLFYLTSPFLRMVLSRTERPWHRTGFSTSGILGRR